MCKLHQACILNDNALMGYYNVRFAIFFAINNLGWKNGTEVENKNTAQSFPTPEQIHEYARIAGL